MCRYQHQLTIFLVFLAAVWATSLPKIDPHIINGDKAVKGQFPWQAAVYVHQPGAVLLCGGSLIGDRWILTVAHCGRYVESFDIALGSTTLIDDDPDRVVVSVNGSAFIQHEGYDFLNLENDIALIRLDEPVEFNDYIQPIELSNSVLEDGSVGTVSGWGTNRDGIDEASNDLNYVDVVTIPNTECADAYRTFIFDGMVCGVGPTDVVQSICSGDNGGALVSNATGKPIQVAVACFVHPDGCSSGQPSGYTRVDPYREWITSKTGI